MDPFAVVNLINLIVTALGECIPLVVQTITAASEDHDRLEADLVSAVRRHGDGIRALRQSQAARDAATKAFLDAPKV